MTKLPCNPSRSLSELCKVDVHTLAGIILKLYSRVSTRNKKLWSFRIWPFLVAAPTCSFRSGQLYCNLIIRCKQNIRLPLTVNEDKNRKERMIEAVQLILKFRCFFDVPTNYKFNLWSATRANGFLITL